MPAARVSEAAIVLGLSSTAAISPEPSEAGNEALTDAQPPRPEAGDVAGHEQIRNGGMQHEHPPPHIERVVAVVSEQKGVVNPASRRISERHIMHVERTYVKK
jgi:hypothetical protein